MVKVKIENGEYHFKLDDILKDKNISINKLIEKQIIYLLYIEEKSIDEISNYLNISKKTILNTKNNALIKLKNDMGGNV